MLNSVAYCKISFALDNYLTFIKLNGSILKSIINWSHNACRWFFVNMVGFNQDMILL